MDGMSQVAASYLLVNTYEVNFLSDKPISIREVGCHGINAGVKGTKQIFLICLTRKLLQNNKKTLQYWKIYSNKTLTFIREIKINLVFNYQ